MMQLSSRQTMLISLGAVLIFVILIFGNFSSLSQRSSEVYTSSAPMGNTGLRHEKSSRLGDGCKHIFLDLGSNTGVQVRKLFEPQKYPGSFLVDRFQDYFGDNRNEVCAFAFEPNPRHYPRLREIEAVYNSLGWRAHMFSAAVGTHNATMYLTQPASYLQQAAHVTSSKPTRGQVVSVPVIDLIEFLRTHILSRSYSSFGNNTGKILVKMDIEGTEFAMLSALLSSGVLCSLDVIYAEFHNHMAPGLFRSINTAEHPVQFSQLLQMIVDVSSVCSTRIERLDDESYGKDTIFSKPLPPYKGAPVECEQNDSHCIMTKPLAGMTEELHRSSVLGLDV